MLWRPEDLRAFLASPIAAEWDAREDQRRIDVAIGQWAESVGTGVWYPWPSLVQHVGQTSTILPGSINRATGRRRASHYVRDLP